MATVAYQADFDAHKGTALVKWLELTAPEGIGGDDGAPFDATGWRLVSVQWYGDGVASLASGRVVEVDNNSSPSAWTSVTSLSSGNGAGFDYAPSLFGFVVARVRPRITSGGSGGGVLNCNMLFVKS